MLRREELATLPLVVLAGGRSARLGTPKALRLVAGQPFIRRQLESFHAVGGRLAVVVLGYSAEAIQAALPEWPPGDLVVTVNPTPERGSFTSLQCGLAAALAAFPAAPGVFVLPVDVPVPGAAVWAALAAALPPSTRAGITQATVSAAVPTYAGRGGHPVALSRAFAASLIAVAPDAEDARLDRQLAASQGVARIPVAEAGIGLNLNAAADWERWEGSLPPTER